MEKNKIFQFLKKHRYEIVLLILVTIYIIYFTTATFLRYDNFYTGRFDLGNMAQTVWNTIHGNTFQLTDPNGTRQISRLAVHADFILILLSPFYFIWANPKMLLLIQTIVLGSGGIFVYLISKELLKNKSISLVFATSLLLNPGLQFANLYDFHGVTLATTFLLASFYFILKKNYIFVFIALVLAGLTKEQVWLINALIGLYILLKTSRKALGAFFVISGISLFYYLVWVAIPHALGGQHFALSYYSDFGSTPTSVIENIFFSPIQTLKDITGEGQINYIRQLFIPFGYLSIFAPISLIPTLPSLGISLLSENPQLYEIYYQYSSTVTPFVVLSAILAVKKINRFIPSISLNFFSLIIIVYALIAAYSFGPLIFSKTPNDDMFTTPLKNKNQIESFLSQIPTRYSISATNNLGSHLSQRQMIYTLPLGIDQADVIAFLMETNDNSTDLSVSNLGPLMQKVQKNPNYKMVINTGNFTAFKKIN